MKTGNVCGSCHGMRHPISGDAIVTAQLEWEESPAEKEGLDCIDCHMKKQSNGLAFHGFSSRYVDASIYEDDIDVRNISLEFPNLTFAVENKITGHSLPTGCPEAILFLEANLKKKTGVIIHTFVVEIVNLNMENAPGYWEKDKRLSGVKLFLRRYKNTSKVLIISRSIETKTKANSIEITVMPLWKFLLTPKLYIQR